MCAVTLVLRCYLLLNHHTPEVDQKLAEAPSSTQGGTGSASPGGSHLAAQPGNRSNVPSASNRIAAGQRNGIGGLFWCQNLFSRTTKQSRLASNSSTSSGVYEGEGLYPGNQLAFCYWKGYEFSILRVWILIIMEKNEVAND